MRKLEIWVENSEAWRELKLNAAGEPVYVSNGAAIGPGMRIARVTDVSVPQVWPSTFPNPITFKEG